MKEEHLLKEIKNKYEDLQIDDFSGEELKRVRLLKQTQELLSKYKNIAILYFLFILIFLFLKGNKTPSHLFGNICLGVIIIVVLLSLLFMMLKNYNYIKKKDNIGISVLLILISICWILFKKQNIPDLTDNIYLELVISIIFGFCLNLIGSAFIYKFVFLIVAKKIDRGVEYKFNIINLLKQPKLYYSVTILMANLFKDEINKITKEVHNNEYSFKSGTFDSIYTVRTRIEVILNSRIYKQYLIIFLNWINVIKTIIFSIIIMGLIGYKGVIINIFIALFFFHFLSRTIEIFYAFYKDIVRIDSKTFYNRKVKKVGKIGLVKYEPVYINDWKNSSIRKPMRISLAIHSIVEVVLSFSLIYYFASLISTSFPTGFALEFGNIKSLHSYLKAFLYSMSVSFFNTSFPNKDLLSSILHIWQVLISIVLISLSIALILVKMIS